MTQIVQIKVEIKTGNESTAGTNGKVFLGIGGREFRLDKPGNQFQKNHTDTFTINSTNSDIENPERNSLPNIGNANSPRIENKVGITFNFPVYLRFDPNDNDDDWNIERVKVRVIGGLNSTFIYPNDILKDGNIWLGNKSGLFLGLRQQ
jgi:PLAT/LH2 domain